jgi:hypothetical protein
MRHTFSLTMLTILVLALCSGARAGDIHLTLENDVELYLHDDHTWSCAPDASASVLANMTITLDDGNQVQLSGKGTWKMVAKEEAASENNTNKQGVAMLYHVGVALDASGPVAAQKAMDIAVKGLAKRLRPLVGAKVREEELCGCIEDIGTKQVDQQEKVGDKSFEVRIKLTLDRETIDGIKECAALSVRLDEKNKEPKAKASPAP